MNDLAVFLGNKALVIISSTFVRNANWILKYFIEIISHCSLSQLAHILYISLSKSITSRLFMPQLGNQLLGKISESLLNHYNIVPYTDQA